MNRTTNRSHKHFILSLDGETITTDKIGSHAGIAAHARMLDRMAHAAGVDRFRCTDRTGMRFEGGFAIEGPFEKLGGQ